MGDSEKTGEMPPAPPPVPPSPERTGAPQAQSSKENVFVPLLLWVVVGIIIGYAVYALALAPNQPPVVPQQNQTNTTVQPVATLPNAVMILINDSRCAGCNYSSYMFESIIASSDQLGLDLNGSKVIDASSAEAQALISQHGITRLPAIVVSKEAGNSSMFVSSWSNIQGTQDTDGSFIFEEYPPYYSLTENRMVGLVDATEIVPGNCSRCFNVTDILLSFTSPQVGMALQNTARLNANTTEAEQLITEYNITRLPALILSPDAGAYNQITQIWAKIGTVAADGSYLFQGSIPPYVDLANGSVMGLVKASMIEDPSCTDCFNITDYLASLESAGIVFSTNVTYYSNSTQGKSYIAKYNITAVPTLILSPDILLYSGFGEYWSSMGSYEKDGMLVLRGLDKFQGKYRNLTTGNVTSGTG